MNKTTSTLIFAICLSFTACSTIPQPVSSTHYRASLAGFGWNLGGGDKTKANAALGVIRTTSTPTSLYLKAFLPNPDGSRSAPIKKKDSGAKGSLVMFEGSDKTGWVPNQRYNFYLEVYSDPQYSIQIDSISQPAVCIVPPLQ